MGLGRSVDMHQIGDRVRVHLPGSRHDGKETVVTSGLISANDFGMKYMGHQTDIPNKYPDYEYCVFEPHELIPIDKATWESVEEMTGWRPRVLGRARTRASVRQSAPRRSRSGTSRRCTASTRGRRYEGF